MNYGLFLQHVLRLAIQLVAMPLHANHEPRTQVMEHYFHSGEVLQPAVDRTIIALEKVKSPPSKSTLRNSFISL